MQWSHTLLGQYNIGNDVVVIDMARNFLDPLQAELAHVHEVTHATLSRTTDMGLATMPIYSEIERFMHLDDTQRQQVIAELYAAQVLPQEGFASLMEMLHLANKVGKARAFKYASDKMPDEYHVRFLQFSYCFAMGKKQQELFTKQMSWLAMETGFREAAPRLDLLGGVDNLKAYFAEPDHNPTERLKRINVLLRGKPWMVTRPVDEIAKAVGITMYEPASKSVVSQYMNYIAKLIGIKGMYTPDMIGDAPGETALRSAAEDARVTNINHDLANTAMFLKTLEDIKFEARHTDCVMVTNWDEYGDREKMLEVASGMKPEVAFVFFSRTGEKYIALATKEVGINLLEGPLKNTTLYAREDMVNMATGEFLLSRTKYPDLVYHDHPKELLARINAAYENIEKVEYLHAGLTTGHPHQMVVIRINSNRALHVANAIGGNVVIQIVELLGAKAEKMSLETLRSEYHESFNDYFGLMGFPWKIDWIETMIDGEEIRYR